MSEQNRNIFCVVDVGSNKIVAICAEILPDAPPGADINVLGWGMHFCKEHVKNGELVSMEGASKDIEIAVRNAAEMSKSTIYTVVVGVGGYRFKSSNIKVQGKVSSNYVTEMDMRELSDLAKLQVSENSYIIMHTINQDYTIDNKYTVTEPQGMSGSTLDGNFHIIKMPAANLLNLDTCISRCHLSGTHFIHQAIASAEAVLTKDEKDLGVCCIDIGSGTTDMVVYVGGKLKYTGSLPVAGDNITRDMASMLKTSFHYAEKLKIKFGSTFNVDQDYSRVIRYPSIGHTAWRLCTMDAFVYIIEMRMKEIFAVCKNELNDNGYTKEVLNAGIVLTGGSSLLKGIVELASGCFEQNVRVGWPIDANLIADLRYPPCSTAYGLLKLARTLNDYIPEVEPEEEAPLPLIPVEQYKKLPAKGKRSFWDIFGSRSQK